MRALSVKQPWAELIARGTKKVEFRTWKVDFRGELLIVASKGRQNETCEENGIDPDAVPYGKAVCVVDLVDVVESGEAPGEYDWKLENPRRVEPVEIRGYAAIYNVAEEHIRLAADRSIERRGDADRV